ncbi:MAG: TonB-dependent receptor, partial [Candidatus Saccharimonadales bacterium]
ILFSQPERDYSVFGALTWNLTRRLKLTGGVRGTEARKTYNYSLSWGGATQLYGGVIPYPGSLCSETTPATGLEATVGSAFAAPACAFTGTRSDRDWFPSTNIQYQIDPRKMIYLRFDQSFLAGGFNGTDTTGNASNIPYRPEYVNAYELGLKTTWLNNRLRLNFDVFRMDYRDLQAFEEEINPVTSFVSSTVQNAAAARSQGVEAEVEWAITDRLRLSSNVSYLEAIYLNYRNAPPTYLDNFCRINYASNADCRQRFPSGIGLSVDMSGQQLPLAPRWSGNLMGTYLQPLPGGYVLTTEVDGYVSSAWHENLLDQMSGGYAVLNGTLGLKTPNGRWSFNIIVKNLADRVYGLGNPSGPYGIMAQPRTVLGQIFYQY